MRRPGRSLAFSLSHFAKSMRLNGLWFRKVFRGVRFRQCFWADWELTTVCKARDWEGLLWRRQVVLCRSHGAGRRHRSGGGCRRGKLGGFLRKIWVRADGPGVAEAFPSPGFATFAGMKKLCYKPARKRRHRCGAAFEFKSEPSAQRARFQAQTRALRPASSMLESTPTPQMWRWSEVRLSSM